MNSFTIQCITIIALAVPMIAYLVPQDPTVTRMITSLTNRHRHRRSRRWVAQQRQTGGRR
jgi:hypothetical protein